MTRRFILLVGLILFSLPLGSHAQENTYVGPKACESCHQEQYDSFMANSKKAHSFANIKKMEKKLSPEEYQECFKCHTTGYGRKGGFVSEALTPDLKNPGCEVCHGPGALHAESGDPDDIVRKMAVEDCTACHNKERISDFDFRPLLYSGGH